MQQVLCPTCDKAVLLPEYSPGVKCVCPHCGATFDIELEGTEDDSAEETDRQDH